MALDLTTARAATETLMVDACTITRDAQGTDDDTLNQTTGALAPPSPDTASIYAGKCLVRPSPNVPQSLSEGGDALVASLYEAALPYTAAAPEPGDVFTVTASGWDAALVGRSFRVKQAFAASVNIRRSVLLEGRT